MENQGDIGRDSEGPVLADVRSDRSEVEGIVATVRETLEWQGRLRDEIVDQMFRVGYTMMYAKSQARDLCAMFWRICRKGGDLQTTYDQMLQGLVKYRKFIPDDVKMCRAVEQVARQAVAQRQKYYETKGLARRMSRPYGDLSVAERATISGMQADVKWPEGVDVEQRTPELVALIKANSQQIAEERKRRTC